MANEVNNTAPFKVIATTGSRLKDLVIENGQLIFIQDRSRIALDFNGKRTFYNQITELDTDYDRTSIDSPSYGYYFVIETAILWFYENEWIQITNPPEEIIFIGTELPELGQKNKLYVNKNVKEISIWDEETNGYITVSDYTNEITDADIENLFN